MPIIEVPGQGQIEFPDSMNDEQIVMAIKRMTPAPAPGKMRIEVDGQSYEVPDDASMEEIDAITKPKPGRAEAYLREKQTNAKAGEYSALESGAKGAAQGATMGFGDEAQGLIQALGQKVLPEKMGGIDYGKPFRQLYRENRDTARFENEAARRAHGGAYVAGEVAGSLPSMAIPGLGVAGTVPGAIAKAAILGGAAGLGGSNADLTQGDFAGVAKDTAKGAAIGALAGGAGELGSWGLRSGAGRLAARAGAAEQRLATQLGDKAAKEAEQIAKSAAGTYGSARAEASRAVDLLMRPTGDAATDAANQAALNSPAGRKLLAELAEKARDRLPDQLEQMANAKALMQQTASDVPAARAAGALPEAAVSALVQRLKAQASRYAIPMGGAALGGVIGGPVGAGIGAAAGRGVSPAVNAVVKNLILSPEARRLAAGGIAAAAGATERAAPLQAGLSARLSSSPLTALLLSKENDPEKERMRELMELLAAKR